MLVLFFQYRIRKNIKYYETLAFFIYNFSSISLLITYFVSLTISNIISHKDNSKKMPSSYNLFI
jgi:hypothetical protein